MTYFSNIADLQELKQAYRKLAHANHPDLGGSEEAMKAINAEYDFATAKLLKGETLSAEEMNSAILNSEKYRSALEAIVALPGLEIELVGSWIWVTGNTYAAKENLKAAGFYFASKKKAWYFRSEENASGGRGRLDLDQIRNKYGSEKVTGYKGRAALS